MNGTENIHLSSDTIEDAVRGRLSPADQAAVKAHCAACKSCRRTYDEELRIAQGTRAWARAAMKQRLAGRVAHMPQRSIPWPRVLAIAALILVVVGVGILYQWLQIGKETVPVFTDNVQPQAEGLARKDRQTSAPAQVEQDLSGYVATEPEADVRRTRKESAPAPGSDRSSLLKSTHIPEEPAAAPFAAVEKADAGDAMQAAGTSEDLILRGTTIQAPLAQKKKVEESRVAETLQDKGAGEITVEHAKATNAAAARTHTFIIGQRARVTLWRDQKDARAGATPAGVERSGDTVFVTLHLDTLLTPAGLRSAFVREFPPDSFQVVLPGGPIGFRAPPGFLR